MSNSFDDYVFNWLVVAHIYVFDYYEIKTFLFHSFTEMKEFVKLNRVLSWTRIDFYKIKYMSLRGVL